MKSKVKTNRARLARLGFYLKLKIRLARLGINKRESLDKIIKVRHRLACLACLVCFACLALSLDAQEEVWRVLVPGRAVRVFVFSNAKWTDTKYEVIEGQMIHFQASGGISLQVGNPIAHCGPDGYNLQTVQQPIRDKNIGALIGRVVQLISVEIDEETGEETRNEIIEEFYIGSENKVRMPIGGRLYLGINENVVEDNSGEFKVLFYLER